MARVQVEMGGKNPLIVLDDADLDLATNIAIDGAFNSTGQKCSATSRVVVQRPVLAGLTERLLAKASALKVGDGLEEDTFVGPIVDEHQYNDVLRYIDIGAREGANLLLDGRRPRSPSDGFFIGPTIFGDCRTDMVISQEEIFGPVIALIPADSFEEAMRIANDTKFGLTASICTRSLAKANRFAREIHAGVVGVNLPTAGVEYQAPFGGVGASGSAFKEQGQAAVDFYSQVKSVAMYYGGE
jgi:aldehyde dehydrogenase (NAD+)